jgi:hypothetical protein
LDVCRFTFLERENDLVASGGTAPSTPASDRRVCLARPLAEGVVLRRRICVAGSCSPNLAHPRTIDPNEGSIGLAVPRRP